LLKESNLIGRADPVSGVFPDVDLSPYDPGATVSRRHARIWRAEGRYWIEDLESVNGTLVNDRRLLPPRTPRALDNGDRVQIGEVVLVFQQEERG
jgi:pSer/pThr/pTyr-binding forkhead associated (FHA) protein